MSQSLAAAFKSSSRISWKSTGKLQQTLATSIVKTGTGLHSGKSATVEISPSSAGKGRFFDLRPTLIPASIDFVKNTALCTTLARDGYSVGTVEHLLSALEACGVDNCQVVTDGSVEVPILDGSAKEWVEAIEEAGLEDAVDQFGNKHEKMAPFVNEPLYIQNNDSFLAALPCPSIHISYGINFEQVPAIGCQWFVSSSMDKSFYANQIAPSRTFCIYEQVEKMQKMGLARGGSIQNAIVCSSSKGWLNPPLRFEDEPCRHKVLDLIGDLSLLARYGSQGLPVAHIIAYKGGHALHTDFVRCLLSNN